MGKQLTLVLGGARSGKSAWAQQLVESSGQPGLFVATATAGDEEMAARIAVHRAARSPIWTTLEAPLEVGNAIRRAVVTDWVLVDCITLLASNVLMNCPEPVDESLYQQAMQKEIDGLIDAWQAHPGNWVIVSNEVGLGLVPPYPLGRYYRDALGRANQTLANIAGRVVFMVAGLPMTVKETNFDG
jgi:adenosylcobinamide kinase/adenosylcobinamide-phosphate guanylyltransferase